MAFPVKLVLFCVPPKLLVRKFFTCGVNLSNAPIKPLSVRVRSSKPRKNENNAFRNERQYPSPEQVELKSFGIDISKLSVREDDDYYNVNEEDYDFAIEHSDKLYDMYKSEKKAHSNLVKRKTIERKFFRQPPEVCLVTYAAKQQIRYLNESNPDEWTPQRLAESFPITEAGVKKLLKHNPTLTPSKERILEHDKQIAERWKELLAGRDIGLSPSLKEKFLAGTLSPVCAVRNSTLPFPAELKPKTVIRRQTGQFLAIVKPYLDLKKNVVTTEERSETNTALEKEDLFSRRTDWTINEDSEMPNFDGDVSSQKRRSYVNVNAQQFHDNMRRELGRKKSMSEMDQMILQWLEDKNKQKPPPPRQQISVEVDRGPSRITKYKDNAIQLRVDVNKDGGHTVSYLYDDKHGYQHPFGKSDPDLARIDIPRDMHKEGALYRLGNSYYDDAGIFLYRVSLDH